MQGIVGSICSEIHFRHTPSECKSGGGTGCVNEIATSVFQWWKKNCDPLVE